MTTASKDKWLILLISSLLVAAPLIVFPAKLGLSLATGSFAYAIVEALYYGVIFFIFCPAVSLMQLLQGAGLTFLYRIVLGTIFGIVISLMYNVGLSAALTLGISRYLPAIIFQIVIAPFALRPLFLSIAGAETAGRKRHIKKYQPPVPHGVDIIRPDSSSRSDRKASAVAKHYGHESKTERPLSGHEPNGFERAVRYLGEHHAVILASVIDMEGLTLASYRKGQIDPEAWAPLALLFHQSNEKILNRNETGATADRLDLFFGSRKLTACRDKNFNLLVLADREDDELIGIRIVQAADMIRKYLSERYGKLLLPSTEEQYVSNS